MDPYVSFLIDKQQIQQTTVHQNAGKEPVWEQTFEINLPQGPVEQGLDIRIMDKGIFGGDTLIANCNYDLDGLRRRTLNPTFADEILDLYYKGEPAGKLL